MGVGKNEENNDTSLCRIDRPPHFYMDGWPCAISVPLIYWLIDNVSERRVQSG